jgi:hypothetical protein
MDKLLAAIKQFDDEEEDLFIVFNSAVWEEKSLILQINLGLVGGNRETGKYSAERFSLTSCLASTQLFLT